MCRELVVIHNNVREIVCNTHAMALVTCVVVVYTVTKDNAPLHTYTFFKENLRS